jgi:hypothetical protein
MTRCSRRVFVADWWLGFAVLLLELAKPLHMRAFELPTVLAPSRRYSPAVPSYQRGRSCCFRRLNCGYTK